MTAPALPRRSQPALAQRERALGAVPAALELVDAVRRWDRRDVQHLISQADLPALCVVLAAMVDQDSSVTGLLEWTEGQDESYDGWSRAEVLDAHAQWEACRVRGIEPPAEVREGQRIYDRVRRRAQRTAQRAAGGAA